jgi:hypothetical protein
MDILSTKTRAEKEDDEAERLVRPSPKLKPPRHDKRRERVESVQDTDSDEEADAKDRSRNHKDVGGSIAGRVLHRYIEAAEEKITVIKKDTGRKVRVSPKTLKDKPGDYEIPKEDEEKPEAPKAAPEPQAPPEDKPDPEAKPEKKPGKEKPPGKGKKETGVRVPVRPLKDHYDSEDEYKESLTGYKESIQKFKTDLEAQLTGKRPSRKAFASEEEFSAAIKAHEKTQAQTQEALDKIAADEILERRFEAEAIPKPPRRAASTQERLVANRRINDTFPPDVAASIISANLHPDDVSNLMKDYEAVVSDPPRPIGQLIGQVGKFYQTDPSSVPIPKTGKNYAGEMVPFEELRPEEKGEAYRDHQIRTVALSLAAKQVVRDSFQKNLTSADPVITSALTEAMFQPPGKDREAKSIEVAGQAFDKTLEVGSPAIPAKNVNGLLEACEGNPDAKRIAVAYLQAGDYNTAKTLFLTRGSGVWGATKKGLQGAGKFLWSLVADEEDDQEAEDAVSEFQDISEWSSPSNIAKGIQGSMEFFKLRARHYPQELSGDRDPSDMFKEKVLKRIETLAPEKFVPAKLWLEQQEIEDYDKDQSDHERKQSEWELERDMHASREPKKPERTSYESDWDYSRATWAYEALTSDREAEIKEWKAANPPPKPSVKPGHYDRVRNPDSHKDLRKWLLSEQMAQYGDKAAATVAARYISSYPLLSSMRPVSAKQAVYHGVAPYRETPEYTHWSQPSQRDFGEADHELILSSAKEWLKTPVLSLPLVGATRDTQLRAALDLAIYSGPYNGAVQPNLYNTLLARLAGANEHETLLTVREASEDSPIGSSISVKVATMKASTEIRKLAAKYAAQNAPLAYDLMDLATRVAQDEQDEDQGQQKQAQDDQDQQDQGQKQASRYASLRSAVIQAASKAPESRPAFVPVLQAIKGLDG